MDTTKWLDKVTERASINSIAMKAKVSQSTLSRHARDGSLTADEVIRISRAYHYPVTHALIEHGLITEDDLRLPAIQATLRDATDQQLVDEIARRLEHGNRAAFDKPLQPVPQKMSDTETKLPPVEELAANPHQLDSEQGDHIE